MSKKKVKLEKVAGGAGVSIGGDLDVGGKLNIESAGVEDRKKTENIDTFSKSTHVDAKVNFELLK